MKKYMKCKELEETVFELETGNIPHLPCTVCYAKFNSIPCPKKHNPYHVTATCWKIRAEEFVITKP